METPLRFADDAAERTAETLLCRLALDHATTFRAVREALTKLGRNGALADDQRVLLDLRDMRFLLTTPEAEALADELSSADALGRHSVALVAQMGVQYGVARMVCTLAELRGGRVKAFMDDREAVDWLMG